MFLVGQWPAIAILQGAVCGWRVGVLSAPQTLAPSLERFVAPLPGPSLLVAVACVVVVGGVVVVR